jgi:hypothetical protein
MVGKYGARGFVAFTVNMLPPTNDKAVVIMAKKGYHFTHLAAPTDRWAAETYDANGAPTTVLLDQDGKVVVRHMGFSLAGVRGMDAMVGALLKRSAQK